MSTRKKDVPLLLSAVGFIGDLISKIVARFKETQALEALHRLVSDEKLSKEFVARFCDLAVSMTQAKVVNKFFWKTITVGTYQSAEAWIKALTGVGFRVGDWAKDVLGKIRKFQAQSQVSFGKATLAELGFTKSATISEIISRIKELGYELCNPDDAPALRLAHKDQPLNEWVWLVMEPIRDSDGNLKVFKLDHNNNDLQSYLGVLSHCNVHKLKKDPFCVILKI